ncbi:hypothetical protein L3V77_23940 [Vibrio sp. DW001]|uniref:hypothetical protein n=1 Tax=Vibrio sp. DW001 TaxID=2912315 RepID=UPI0023B14EBC|nr:hypothetical protein [Vibrio sp. DW001]WED28990.1 hypothetical protein L3V77_23940 [Vibrio sp. DW001]
MKQILISRIHTNGGIFRISASIDKSQSITYQSVDFMSTDGWCELDIESVEGKRVLLGIETKIIEHIES